MLTIATWNVNSIKVRLPQVLRWLSQSDVDVLAIQETKVTDEQFPAADLVGAGYHVAFSGQQTYNGVAIVSRYPIDNIITEIPGVDTVQKRTIIATIQDIALVNLYVPNGSAVGADKYHYKLEWLAGLKNYLIDHLKYSPKTLIVGDFNIAPDDRDVHDPIAWDDGILVSPAERAAYQDILSLGFTDAFRLFHQDNSHYSWWDYRAGGFQRNHGLRIDLSLLSDALQPYCHDCRIDTEPRHWERPSDHTPVITSLVL